MDGEIEFEASGSRSSEGYDQVVNALWDGRLAVDAAAGVQPTRSWLFRTKYDVRLPFVRQEARVPPTLVVLGPFGDVVTYANGEMYLSWYPAGMRDASSELTPAPWQSILEGDDAVAVRDETLAGLAEVIPALSRLTPDILSSGEVRGGIIFAWGATDITDARSDLHTRFDVGPSSYGRYHSVDTGKLTTAPLFAKQLADHILRAD
jgi:hypothetical protein